MKRCKECEARNSDVQPWCAWCGALLPDYRSPIPARDRMVVALLFVAACAVVVVLVSLLTGCSGAPFEAAPLFSPAGVGGYPTLSQAGASGRDAIGGANAGAAASETGGFENAAEGGQPNTRPSAGAAGAGLAGIGGADPSVGGNADLGRGGASAGSCLNRSAWLATASGGAPGRAIDGDPSSSWAGDWLDLDLGQWLPVDAVILTGTAPLPSGIGIELEGVRVPVSTGYAADRLSARVDMPGPISTHRLRLVLEQGGSIADLSLVCAP